MAGANLAAATNRRRPNLLFIVADTWRAQALRQAGDPNVSTPNLEKLAEQGVSCSRVYASYPVCCPSRAAMLTGKLPHAAGVRRNHSLLPLGQQTISAALKEAGYRTGYIGKWHLDGGESPGFVPPERRRGFDEWFAYNVAHRHYDPVYFRNDPTPVKTTGFEPDVQTRLALDFLRTKSQQPHFLYLSYVAPHAPFTPPQEATSYDPAKLQLRPNVPPAAEASARRDLAGYYGLCSAVDRNIGLLLGQIEEQGSNEDTIVVFTSDHGITLWSHGVDEIDAPYEESARIPLIVRYPRHFRGGLNYGGLISNIDFAPTLLSLCGVRIPGAMQGLNLARRLGRQRPEDRGGNPGSIYAEGGLDQEHEWRMVVEGRYKLVVNSKVQPVRLHDLFQDPYEQDNLTGKPQFEATISRLQALRRRWAVRTGDTLR